MSEDSMLMCLIAFILGFLVARMIRGDGLDTREKFVCPTTTAEFIKKIVDGGIPNFRKINEGVCFDTTRAIARANVIHNQENCSDSGNTWCPFSSSPPPAPDNRCLRGACAAPGARYCSDLVGACEGPGGVDVNGKVAFGLTRFRCERECDSNEACVGYSYAASGPCIVHGPGLDTDLAADWTAQTHPNTTITSSGGNPYTRCATKAGHNDPDNPPVV